MEVQSFTPGGYYMGANHLGNPPEMIAMLQLASEKQIEPWIMELEMSEGGCKEAVERVHRSDVRYRFTLTNFEKV